MSNKNKLTIYEGAICCSSGVCGSTCNQDVIDFQKIIDNINKSGFIVVRYNITQHPNQFIENPQIVRLIQEQQLRVLPIFIFNEKVIKVGSYPTDTELLSLLGANT